MRQHQAQGQVDQDPKMIQLGVSIKTINTQLDHFTERQVGQPDLGLQYPQDFNAEKCNTPTKTTVEAID